MGQELIMAGLIHSKAVAFVNAHSTRIILSSIVVAELYAGVKGDTEQAALENFVSLFRVVPVSADIYHCLLPADGKVAKRAGEPEDLPEECIDIPPWTNRGMSKRSCG